MRIIVEGTEAQKSGSINHLFFPLIFFFFLVGIFVCVVVMEKKIAYPIIKRNEVSPPENCK